MRKPITDLNLVFYDYAEKASQKETVQRAEPETGKPKLYNSKARRASYWPDGMPDTIKDNPNYVHNPRKLVKDYHDTDKD